MTRVVYTLPQKRDFRRRKKVNWAIAGFVVFCFLAGGGTIIAVRSPAWHITDIRITGAKTVGGEAVQKKIAQDLAGYSYAVIPRAFYFFVDGEEVKQSILKHFPKIATLRIYKHYPAMLDIDIEERTVWGIFCNDLTRDSFVGNEDISEERMEGQEIREDKSKCVYIDSTGYSFEYAPRSKGALIKRVRSDVFEIPHPAQIIDPSLMSLMHFLDRKIAEEVGETVIEFAIPSRAISDIRALTNGGFQIWFNRNDNYESVFSILKILLNNEIRDKRNELEYIDLRIGSKVFYKYKTK